MDSDATTHGEAHATMLPVPAPTSMPSPDALPPFLVKTYNMVDDASTDRIVSWGPNGNTFVVWDVHSFERDLLPNYFIHNKFSAFHRQLNAYGFRKVDADRFEFANAEFLRGQKHLLESIARRKRAQGHTRQKPHGPSAQSCIEVGKFGLKDEIEMLKRDKNVLMDELVRLRQQQQNTEDQLHSMVQRLQGLKQREQEMISILTKAGKMPCFLQFIKERNESNMRITEGCKRRIKHDGDGLVSDNASGQQIVKYNKPLADMGANYVTQTRTPGVALQEVPSSSGPSVFGLNSRASLLSPSQLVPESCPDAADATASGLNGLTFRNFLGEGFGWDNSFLDNDIEGLRGNEDIFWEDIVIPQRPGRE